MSNAKKIASAALHVDAGDVWPPCIEVHEIEHATPIGILHLVYSKRVDLGETIRVRLLCTCGALAHVGVDDALSVSQRHEFAYRRRMGIVGALHSCICCWPLEVEPTSTGHSPACPSDAMLSGEMVQLRPGQCCARDVNGVGSCDMHSAPGALRAVGERDRALHGAVAGEGVASNTTLTLADGSTRPPWEDG